MRDAAATSPPPAASLADQFERHDGKTSGFDYLRIVLAVAVLVWHSYGLTYGREAIDAAMAGLAVSIPVALILPMFFALSGFLVTSSLYRANSIKVYLVFRGLRLFPALTVEVLLAVFLLGPIFTSLALGEYFSHRDFFLYFLNIVGLIRYELPGLFEDNVYPRVVNGSLWTVPYELECYIYLVVLSLMGVFRSRYAVLAAFVAVTLLVVLMGFTSGRGVVIALKDLLIGSPEVEPNLQQATGARVEIPRILVLCFLAGALLYAWRDRVPFHPGLAAAALVASAALLASPQLYFYAPLPVAYLTVWLGLNDLPRATLLRKGDYSYGIYLYAFPLQQVVSASGWAEGAFLLHAALSLAMVSIFAAFSWHVVEKPCLRLKTHFL
ncbi:acyltransferase family protein [Jannaschia seohaensis]|uniref:Peptidoglycan/LPS O-acetylase OafA/YrhL n=1 Tax=Jannaschia seohaensis TaxID=475081 RepID=A0A2Y9B6X9_9RHOB|nr:acyltransferase [Jannaschia seohaensis]PWJ12929.1 peptidoglycan/LPS O-acetylase OafA/YrhL [Jannaschia seohaensis]SSA50737.1 Peptidoglycan/LPS O-acetylase OafA/YrhL, contains acyltransferase and SGNH-hydrolase domains [Jannaschia seohaensis]